MWKTLKTLQCSNKPLSSLKKLNQQLTIKYNHSTKLKFKTNQTLTMKTILIITKKPHKNRFFFFFFFFHST